MFSHYINSQLIFAVSTLPLSTFKIKVLYSCKSFLEDDNIKIQNGLYVFQSLLPFVCKISTSLMASKANLRLWAKQLNIEAKRVSIFNNKLNAFNVLYNKVCPIGCVMYPIHKWGMFLHKLGGDMYRFSHLEKI